MQLRTELAATILSFLALVLLLAFTAIGLLVRMGPAIEDILRRNDVTIVAAEEVLGILAAHPGQALEEPERAKVEAAIQRMRDNLTEPGEEKVVAAIGQRLQDAAASTDGTARIALVDELGALLAINRAAMRRADADAQRLGLAGAWAAAFVGIAALVLGLYLTRSLGRRVVRPIRELQDVLQAAHQDDHFRRCVVGHAAPELRRVLEHVNLLLDERTPPEAAERADR
jgi:methyl-accepting chemotaxis protein